jgi:hypothetical protein
MLSAAAGVVLGVWTVKGSSRTNSFMSCNGTQSAALNAGGHVLLKTSQEYNGTSWSGVTDMTYGRRQHSNIGTQTAGLIAGGNDANVTTPFIGCLEYNGTTWSGGGNLPVAMNGTAGAGTQTAGLLTVTTTSREYNGSSWATGGSTNSTHNSGAGDGSQTAAYIIGNYTDWSSVTEEYNGTAWTTVNSCNVVRGGHGSAGVQTAGLIFGGDTTGTTDTLTTESYDGTDWSMRCLLNAGGYFESGCGASNNSCLKIGSSASEEYTE